MADGERPATGGSGDEGIIAGLAHAVERIDDLVPEASGPANAVPVETSRYLPWVGVLFAVCSVVLVPWIVYIAATLPHRALSPNYDVAWAGFDILLLVSLGTTALTVLRRSPWMATAAGSSAALLVTDAWFDTMTTPSADVWGSVLLTLLVELPLAAVCLWTARHATDIVERRIRVLLRARRRSRPTG